jgi:serine/threonine-protein kinase
MAYVRDELVAAAEAGLAVSSLTELGGGAQKAVRVVDRRGQKLVMKVISLGGSNVDGLRRAEREVELLASIDSPHVVRVEHELIELGDPPAGAAWLEEYLDGADLTASIFSSSWTWTDVRTMAIQVAEGLGAAHLKGVVHRDLSPNNVRHLADGSYKVMDFGFARHTLRSGLTVAGQPGTPGYMSPEHLRSYSGAPTAASDVFAVGVLMFAALTGSVPVPYNGDDADYIRRLQDVERPAIVALRSDLTPGQIALVDRCLHRQPARRYRNGIQLAIALRETA